jgi:hypothetical protein
MHHSVTGIFIPCNITIKFFLPSPSYRLHFQTNSYFPIIIFTFIPSSLSNQSLFSYHYLHLRTVFTFKPIAIFLSLSSPSYRLHFQINRYFPIIIFTFIPSSLSNQSLFSYHYLHLHTVFTYKSIAIFLSLSSPS